MQADDVNGVNIELRDLRLAVVTSQHRTLRQAAKVLIPTEAATCNEMMSPLMTG